MGPLPEGKPRLYLRECLSARSSSARFPESVSSRLMERNFFKGILRRKKTQQNDNKVRKMQVWRRHLLKNRQLVALQIRLDPHTAFLSVQRVAKYYQRRAWCLRPKHTCTHNTQQHRPTNTNRRVSCVRLRAHLTADAKTRLQERFPRIKHVTKKSWIREHAAATSHHLKAGCGGFIYMFGSLSLYDDTICAQLLTRSF